MSRSTRRIFHTRNDTEFAGLALYLSKRQIRAQKGEFPVNTNSLVKHARYYWLLVPWMEQLSRDHRMGPEGNKEL
jgi:hypothetical protein